MRGHRLGVDVLDRQEGIAAGHDALRLRQVLPARRLEGAGRAHDEDAVPDLEQLVELDRLELHDVVHEIGHRRDHVVHALLEGVVHHARRVPAREEVVQQAEEDDLVHFYDFGDVEVSQRPHQDVVLLAVRVGPEEHARHHQHGLDGTQAPVVVLLLREQVFEQRVQRVELGRERLGRHEALGHEHVLADHDEVGDHDGHRPEQRLEALRQGRPPQVPGVHRDVRAARFVELHDVALDGRHARLLVERTAGLLGGLLGRHDALDARAHGLELDRAHREHLGDQPIKLVEAAPAPAAGQPLEDVAQRLVVHLRGTVEDVAALAQRAGEVLGALRLARAGRPRRRAAHAQVQGLGGGHVDAVGQRRHHEARTVPQVLEPVVERRVQDEREPAVLLGVVLHFQLTLPFKRGDLVHFHSKRPFDHVSRMGVVGNHAHDLGPRRLVEVRHHALDEVRELLQRLLLEV